MRIWKCQPVLKYGLLYKVLELAFSEKTSANNFALSDTKAKTLNGGQITELLLLKTLSAITQEPLEPTFWDVKDSIKLH